jgi:2-methylcitrate dehydratase
VEGPLQVIEGPLGINHLLGMKINIDWEKEGYEGVVGSTIKKYNAMIHTQSAVHCMVELAKANKVDPQKVTSIEAEIFQLAYDFAGGGLYGVDKVIRIKEQADHSLPAHLRTGWRPLRKTASRREISLPVHLPLSTSSSPN